MSLVTQMDNHSGIQRFDGTEYQDWKTRMYFLLRERQLQGQVERQPTPEDLRNPFFQSNERILQNLIAKHVAPNVLESIKFLTSSYEMMLKIEQTYSLRGVGSRSVIRKRLQQLRFDGNGPLLRHLQVFDSLVQEYRNCGGQVLDDEIYQYLFESLPSPYLPMISTLQVREKDKKLTYELAKNCLLEFEVQLNVNKPTESSSDSTAFHAGSKKKSKSRIRCFNCNGMGHKSADCRKPKRNSNNHSSNSRGSNWAVLGAEQGSTFLCTANSNEITFILDSGATEHLVTSGNGLVNRRKLRVPMSISVAKDEQLNVAEAGDVCHKRRRRAGGEADHNRCLRRRRLASQPVLSAQSRDAGCRSDFQWIESFH